MIAERQDDLMAIGGRSRSGGKRTTNRTQITR